MRGVRDRLGRGVAQRQHATGKFARTAREPDGEYGTGERFFEGGHHPGVVEDCRCPRRQRNGLGIGKAARIARTRREVIVCMARAAAMLPVARRDEHVRTAEGVG